MDIKRTMELGLALARADFKNSNENSYLGILWYPLNPLLMFGLLLAVFSTRLGNNIPNYPLYLLIGIIMFNFFRKTTVGSSSSIIRNAVLLKSVKFPRESLVLSVVLKSLFSHIFEVVILFAFLVFFQNSLIGMIFYPILLMFLFIFVLGFSMFISAVSVYFADIENIWSFATSLIWLGTPIFYSIGGQARLLFVNMFNPMYYFITAARDIVIYSSMPEMWMIAGIVLYSFVSLFVGLAAFGRLKHRFAELV